MKQTLLAIAMFMAAIFGAQAQTSKTYTDYLVVTINDESSTPQSANINVTVADNLMTFALKNFCLVAGEDKLGVGNIELDNIALTATETEGVYSFAVNQGITITEGDLEGVDVWIGPSLGEIPIALKGTICNEKLYVTIDIDMMSSLGQIIRVQVGNPIDNKSMKDKVYADYLTVTINEESSQPQVANISVSVVDNKMNFSLKNFCLVAGEDKLGVGNISLDDVELKPTDVEGVYSFEVVQNIVITEGDLEGIDVWIGPALAEIPIVLKGTICDKKLYVTIDIDMMSSLGQIIQVTVGTPIDNTILFPKTVEPTYYTITFVVDGQTISSEKVEEGAAITAPTIEEREGYTFAWKDEIPATATADATINGAYTINKYTITWMIDGEVFKTQTLDHGTAINAPTAEEREGYTFAWKDEIPGTATADVTINGSYTINQYTITWMVDGEVYETQTLDFGTAITAPAISIEGRIFDGWGEVPATMPAHDVTINGSTHLDGIKNVSVNENVNMYDLSGRRANKNTRGIVIINGKKILK